MNKMRQNMARQAMMSPGQRRIEDIQNVDQAKQAAYLSALEGRRQQFNLGMGITPAPGADWAARGGLGQDRDRAAAANLNPMRGPAANPGPGTDFRPELMQSIVMSGKGIPGSQYERARAAGSADPGGQIRRDALSPTGRYVGPGVPGALTAPPGPAAPPAQPTAGGVLNLRGDVAGQPAASQGPALVAGQLTAGGVLNLRGDVAGQPTAYPGAAPVAGQPTASPGAALVAGQTAGPMVDRATEARMLGWGYGTAYGNPMNRPASVLDLEQLREQAAQSQARRAVMEAGAAAARPLAQSEVAQQEARGRLLGAEADIQTATAGVVKRAIESGDTNAVMSMLSGQDPAQQAAAYFEMGDAALAAGWPAGVVNALRNRGMMAIGGKPVPVGPQDMQTLRAYLFYLQSGILAIGNALGIGQGGAVPQGQGG